MRGQRVRAVVALLLAAGAGLAWAQEPRVKPAVNDPPTDQVGERHYAFENRQPTRPATLNFDDIGGWTVGLYGEAEGEMVRTREAQIWSEYVAKVSCNLPGRGSRVELRPPEPIALPEDFDCVNLWVRTGEWYVYAKPPVAPRLSLRLRDAGGEEHLVRLGTFYWKDWFLAHRRVVRPPHAEPGTAASGGDGNGRLDMPAVLEAIVVEGTTGGKTAALYLDHLCFYREELRPLNIEPVDTSDLFPTTPDTILPTCHAKHETSASGDEKGAAFVYRGEDGTLTYRVDPAAAGFSGVTAQWADGPEFRPMAAGGPEFTRDDQEVPPDELGLAWRTVRAQMDGEVYRVQWRVTLGDVAATGTTTYEIKGKSLVVTVDVPGGLVAGVRIGQCEGLERPQLVRVSFLTRDRQDPHVLSAGAVFVSAFFDHYVTEASLLDGGGAVLSRTAARYNGGCKYLPKTDGQRNDAHERIFLTVSPTFDEVLPNIPNPPNPYSKMMVDRAWWDVGRKDLARIEQMYRWGLRKAMMEYNGVIWEKGTDFTRRSFYADGGINVGAEDMAKFGETIQGLGYLFGLHTNYCILPPGTHRLWDEDLVTRGSDGEWKTGWGRSYAVKPSRVAELQRHYSTLKKERFDVNCEYIDQTTAFSVGRNVDFDARVPLAGRLRGQFEAYGKLLRDECEIIGGPVISEGPRHWVYAGLAAGNYGQMLGRDPAWAGRTMLVDFDLLKIHPLQCDAGIGIPYMFYGRGTMPEIRKQGLHGDGFDRWVAWSLACGHTAQLAPDWGNPGLIKSYYMVQPAQQHYALVPVERIQYFDGERLLTTSDAIRTGAVKRNQVRVEYENGLSVHVNGSWTDDWLVESAGTTWLLPPAGYLLHRPGALLEYSALIGPNRVDCVQTRDVCYLDSRGEWSDAGGLATDGAAACFRDEGDEDAIWVVPAMAAGVIAFRPQYFGLKGDTCEVTAWSFTEPIGEAPWRKLGGMIALTPEEGVAAYKVVVGGGKAPESVASKPAPPALDFVLSPRKWVEVPEGEAVEAKVVVIVSERARGPVELTVLDGRGGRNTFSLVEGLMRIAEVNLPHPREADGPIQVTATNNGTQVQRRFRLSPRESESVVVDLMSPQLEYVWGYARRGQDEQRPREVSGPGYVRFVRSSGSCDGLKRPAFAAPPAFDKDPHGYVFGEFSLALPQEDTDLVFGIGINETAVSADGVVFGVTLTDEDGRQHKLLEAHHSNGPWRDERISLAEFAGQWVTLRCQTDCGPNDDAEADSARWAEPRIVRHTAHCDLQLEEVSEGSR